LSGTTNQDHIGAEKKELQKEDAMKTRWWILTVLCLLLAGPMVVAEDSWTSKTTTYVPFDFVVNGTALPAGNYVVRTYSSGKVLMIQNKDKPAYVKVALNNDYSLREPKAIHESSKLVFALINGQHVLHQVCIAGDNHTHDIIHGNDVAELIATR
jgi:hypothetical protein